MPSKYVQNKCWKNRKKIYFTHNKGTNITGSVIQSPEHDLAEATDGNCVIRILAERSLVQPTDKKKK